MPNSAPNDPLAKLKALTKSTAGEATFAHESEEEVLRRLLGVFARVPTGQALLDGAKAHGIGIKLLKGQSEFSYSPDSNIVYLGLPAGQAAPRARMLLHLAMGLKEAEQQFTGLPRPNPQGMTPDQFAEIHVQKQKLILFSMIYFAHELVTQLGLREILDELTKMGHINLYEAYEEDLQSASNNKV